MGSVRTFESVSFFPILDGTAERAVTAETFSAIKSGAGTNAFNNSQNLRLVTSSTTTNQFQGLDRQITLFDTSTLPSSATITSASLIIPNIILSNHQLGNMVIHVVSSNPASTSTVVASDYSTLGSTSFSSVAQSSLSVGSSATFNLNSSGIANINNTVSKFGFISDWDLLDSFTGTWAGLNEATTVWWNYNAVSLNVSYYYDTPTLSITGLSSITGISTITTS